MKVCVQISKSKVFIPIISVFKKETTIISFNLDFICQVVLWYGALRNQRFECCLLKTVPELLNILKFF